MTVTARDLHTKVPMLTLGFWIIKILATTLGETGGDTASMTMELGGLGAADTPSGCEGSTLGAGARVALINTLPQRHGRRPERAA